MDTTPEAAELRQLLRSARASGATVALVPTMGNLHEGHLNLMRAAHEHGTYVVATIFVNPLQFGAGEDLDSYPRTLEEDIAKLTAEGVDLLFNPAVAEVYPEGMEKHTHVIVPELSEILCGESRPTHFRGVTTIVCKLLNLIQPDAAIFGEKDFQQLAIIRRMVADLQIPTNIVGCPITREADGLAMSSRNNYLTDEERAIAPSFNQVLRDIEESITSGERDLVELERRGADRLSDLGLRPDYVAIRDASSLQQPATDCTEVVILGAVFLGKTRLIDNARASLTA